MRFYLCLSVCACLFCCKVQAQTNCLDTVYKINSFANIFGANGSCLQLSDTTFVISATGYLANSHCGAVLFAINIDGDTLWEKSYQKSNIGSAFISRCILDNNKNILSAGEFEVDSLSHASQAMLFKTDSAGQLQWLKTYGITHYSEYQGAYGCVPITTFDDHYFVVGTLDIDSVNADLLLIKTDSNGNEQLRYQYGTPKYDLPQAGIQTQDSGFLMAGLTTFADVPGYYTFSIYIVKADKNGNLLWDTIYSSLRDNNNQLLNDAVANDVLEDTDGYLVCGNRFAQLNTVSLNPSAFQKAWIAKLNKQDGSIIWEQNIGIDNATFQRFYKMTKTKDGGYAACGVQIFSNQTTGDCWLVKTDVQGDSIWSRRFYYANNDTLTTAFYNILQTHDNAYILTGYAAPHNGPVFPWVVITDSMGCLIPGCDTITVTDIKALPTDNVGLVVYPNPAGAMAYILIKTDNEMPDLSFKIYDLTGQLIISQTHASTDVTYLLNTFSFAKGMYLLDVMSDGKIVANKKFVKD